MENEVEKTPALTAGTPTAPAAVPLAQKPRPKVKPGKADVKDQKNAVPVNKASPGIGGLSENAVATLMKGNVNTNLEALANIERFMKSRAGHAAIAAKQKAQDDRWKNYAANKDAEFMQNAKTNNFENSGFWMGNRRWQMLAGDGSTKLENGIDANTAKELNGWISEIVTGKNAKGESRAGGKFNVNKLPKDLIMYDADGKAQLDASKITSQEQLNAVVSMMKGDRKGQALSKAENARQDAAAVKKAGEDVVSHLVSTGLSREDAVKRVNGMSNDTVKTISNTLVADREEKERRRVADEAARVRKELNVADAKAAAGSFLDGGMDEDSFRKAVADAGVSESAIGILKRAQAAIAEATPTERGPLPSGMDDARMHPERHPEIQETATPKADATAVTGSEPIPVVASDAVKKEKVEQLATEATKNPFVTTKGVYTDATTMAADAEKRANTETVASEATRNPFVKSKIY